MGEIVKFDAPEHLSALTLEELFSRAETFGNVRIHSSRDTPPPNCYSCKIEFDSIPGTSVEAQSDHWMGIAECLIMAIDRAERIVKNYGATQ